MKRKWQVKKNLFLKLPAVRLAGGDNNNRRNRSDCWTRTNRKSRQCRPVWFGSIKRLPSGSGRATGGAQRRNRRWTMKKKSSVPYWHLRGRPRPSSEPQAKPEGEKKSEIEEEGAEELPKMLVSITSVDHKAEDSIEQANDFPVQHEPFQPELAAEHLGVNMDAAVPQQKPRHSFFTMATNDPIPFCPSKSYSTSECGTTARACELHPPVSHNFK